MSTVLVVDDEFDISEAIASCLRAEGLEVEVRANGLEAMDYLREHRPSLVILDVMMPYMGGLDVLKALRKLPRVSDVPVLLISAAAVKVKQSEYGWTEFLKKPFNIDALLKIVEKHVAA